jgi:putative FmdB family regulatory protein
VPTYEYVCEACAHELEAFQSISAPPLKKCPACGKARLKRKLGAGAGLIFKGSGFYITDYRSGDYKSKAEADSKAASGGKEGAAKEGAAKDGGGKESSGKDAAKTDAGKGAKSDAAPSSPPSGAPTPKDKKAKASKD